MKGQLIRAADVLVIGPLLIYLASLSRQLTDAERQTLNIVGWGTIAYNLYNLLRGGR